MRHLSIILLLILILVGCAGQGKSIDISGARPPAQPRAAGLGLPGQGAGDRAALVPPSLPTSSVGERSIPLPPALPTGGPGMDILPPGTPSLAGRGSSGARSALSAAPATVGQPPALPTGRILAQGARGLTPGAAAGRAATELAQRAPTWTPGANATISIVAVPPEQAQEALGVAISALKGKSVRVTGAKGYTGSANLALPTAIQELIDNAIGADGTGYYGLYNGVNQAVMGQAAGSNAAGDLTLLVEPKPGLPADATQAQSQLATLFPGVKAPLSPVPSVESLGLPTGFAFYGVSGNTAYLLGYASYEGVNVAYALAGSGSYQGAIPHP